MSDDGKNINDEKPAANSKLESLSKEELIKLFKNQLILKKKLDAKISELSTSNISLCQTEEQLRNELEDEQLKTKNLIIELDQYKINESKLQQKLNITNESLECFQLQNDSLKSSCKNLQDEISNLRLSLTNVEQNLTNKLNEYENTIENLQLEIDDLRIKSNIFDQDKQLMNEEIDNYRKQIEDFQFQKTELLINQSNENFDEIISQRIYSLINSIDDEEQYISKTLLNIPTLFHSIGITNEDFSNSLNLQNLLRLCSLLIERCKILQNNTMSNNLSIDKELISIIKNDNYEQCRLLIHRQDHSGLDTFFQQLYSWMNQSNDSNDWQISLVKPIDQSANQYIRLELNDFKFVPEQIEHELIQIRSQFDQLSKENEEQRHEISTFKENLHSSEQFAEQHEKINQLQNIIEQNTIDKTKFDQLESSYQELQEKYLLLEQIKSEYDLLKENFHIKNLQLEEQKQINDKLKVDYEHQHFYLLERDENIHLLKLEIEQQKQFLDNINHNQDQRYSSLLKQYQQLTDLLETKINENKKLNEINQQFENNLKENTQLFFDKTKQADDLDKQLQILNNEYNDIKIQFHQLQYEKTQDLNNINLLNEKLQNFQREKSEYIQMIDHLKQELEKNKENIQIENQLQQKIENLKQELELTKNLQLKYTEEKQLILENEQNQTYNLQQENEKLNQIINELNHKLEIQKNEFDDLKDKNKKMKTLLTRLNKELQEKSQQPKQSLIDLEIADYAKTIKTLEDNLIHKDKEIQDIHNELINLNEKNLSLKQEIENIEQQKLQTEERANKLKILLDTTKKELQDIKDLEQERHEYDDNIRTLNEKLQIELDNNKVILSQLLLEKQQLIERFNNQCETTQRTIHLFEQNLRIAKHDLDISKKDYETLQDDFNNYKIRAQSVLKQHQSTQRERIPSVTDKQTELEETNEKLKTTLREANNKIQLLISENEALQKEQDRLTELQTKIINESRKREQDLRKQHQIELDKMENEYIKRTNDNHDMMKNITIQNETISITFKEQITAIEADHERSILILQNQLQTSKQEIEQLKNRIELLRQTNIDNEKESSQIGINNDFNKDDLPWNYSERQQGEGSESVSTDYQSTDVAVKTLENVLFGNTTNTRSSPSLNLDKPRHILFEDVELERQRIEEELNKTKYRLLNTTELLNESELNNVRLSEQVSLLKDEIRRIERNMDRAESISNLEYLKNIILKFFILKSTHERLQLIPVLVTMLKLSPDEQAKLVHVAQQTVSIDDTSLNSQSNTQQVTNNVNLNSSWTSYLNMW